MQMMRRRSKKKLGKFDVVVMESVKFLDGVTFFGKALRVLLRFWRFLEEKLMTGWSSEKPSKRTTSSTGDKKKWE